MYLDKIKVIYEKPAGNSIFTGNTIFNGGELKAFALRSRVGQGCALSSVLLNNGFEVLVRVIRQEKYLKVTQIGTKEVKL